MDMQMTSARMTADGKYYLLTGSTNQTGALASWDTEALDTTAWATLPTDQQTDYIKAEVKDGIQHVTNKTRSFFQSKMFLIFGFWFVFSIAR